MGIQELEIDNVPYTIFIKTKGGNSYEKLCVGLLQSITKEDYKRITHVDKNGKCIIIYSDLINCFVVDGDIIESGFITNKCICGHEIKDNYIIRNKTSDFSYIVGSTCIETWRKCFNDETQCFFCKRNKSNGINCKQCKGKKNMNLVFQGWKNYISEVKNNRKLLLLKKRSEYNSFLSYTNSVVDERTK